MGKNSKSPYITLSLLILSVYVLRYAPSTPSATERITQTNSNTQALQDYCASVESQALYTGYQNQGNAVLDTSFDSLRGQYSLFNYVMTDPSFGFIYEYATQLAIYSVFGIVLAIMTFCSCFYYCCDCKCCSNCFEHNGKNRRLCAFFGLVMIVAVAGLSIAGSVTSINFNTSILNLGCSFGQVVEVLINGNQTDSWIGITPAATSFASLVTNITNAVNTLPTTATLVNPVNDQGSVVVTSLNTIISDYGTVTVSNPNISITTGLTPTFVSNLGPLTDSSSYTGSLYEEFKTKNSTVVSALETIGAAISTIQNQASSFLQPLNQGLTQIQNASTLANQYFDTYISYLTQAQSYESYPKWGLVAYFAVFAVFSVIIFLSMLLTLFCGCDPCNKCTGCSWFCLSIFVIWGFIISAILLPLAVASQDTCDLAIQLLTNQTVFDQLAGQLNFTTVTNYSDICLFGNGDLLGPLGVTNQINELKNMSNTFIDVSNYSNIPDSLILPGIQDYIYLYTNGLLPAAPVVSTLLTSLNQATDYNYTDSVQNCHKSLDDWMLNNLNCTGNTINLIQSNITGNFGSQSCIGFKQTLGLNFTNRYNGQYNGCQSVGNNNLTFEAYILSLVSGFQEHLTTVNTQFTSIGGGFSQFETDNHDYTDTYLASIQSIKSLNGTVNNVLDTPLLNQVSCKFVGTESILFVNGFCGGFMTNFFTLVWIIFATCTVAFISMLPVFCAARVLKKKDEDDDNSGIELREHLPDSSRVLVH